jgi:hypothetical protein
MLDYYKNQNKLLLNYKVEKLYFIFDLELNKNEELKFFVKIILINHKYQFYDKY